VFVVAAEKQLDLRILAKMVVFAEMLEGVVKAAKGESVAVLAAEAGDHQQQWTARDCW